jgi:protein-disulfide isomerase
MPPVPRPGKRDFKLQGRTLVLVLVGAAAAAAVLIVGSLLLSDGGDGGSSPPTVTTPTVLTLLDGIEQHGTVLGSPNAKVTLVQYEDLQCPFCKRYDDDVVPTLLDEYVRGGDVKLDFRGLAFIGEDSDEALKAVLAAAKQDKAWQMILLLYDTQGAENSGWVTTPLLRDLGGRVDGLDVDKMLADAQTETIAKEVERLAAEAQQRGVPGTPAFLVQVGSQQPYSVTPRALTPDAFRSILDDALAG